MLKIRLKKFGRKKQPSYRIIVIDSKKRRDGKAIEELGFYNPLTKETKLNIAKLQTRMSCGAQLTKTVKDLLYKNTNQMLYQKEVSN
uniref:Ribosomal protein S16 n=2 Tax=Gelidium TaxID=2811 RepID=A0A411FT44_9FLOR|nr:ribosomal protein S16 [Gelidium coulteri]YP_009565317.1 ribosomal protein S16 [Gelidium sinicola]QBA96268.1 ribosomal protein S16 [Gelidium coulteri]QBA96668.1 ribosomal protein S16 [Gelidium sinicola]